MENHVKHEDMSTKGEEINQRDEGHDSEGKRNKKEKNGKNPEKSEKKKKKKWYERKSGWAMFNEKDMKKYYGTPRPDDLIPEDRSDLEIFQNLVGIHFLREGGGMLHPKHQKALGHYPPVNPLSDIFLASKTASQRFRNRGLYNRCLAQDQKNRVMYTLSNYIITTLYLLQILIAAAITGLSAYEQNASVPLTVLGAINAVLAGVLAWLNGQGMPIRFRRARDQYRECVKAIEAAERMFAEAKYLKWAGDSKPNPFKVRDDLEKMYEEARADQESNYPDTQEGPSKTQMESTQRAMEGQLDEHVTEKNKQAENIKSLQADLAKATQGDIDRQNAIQRDHDEAVENHRVKAENKIKEYATELEEVMNRYTKLRRQVATGSGGEEGSQRPETAADTDAPMPESRASTMATASAAPMMAESLTPKLQYTNLQVPKEPQETNLQKLNRGRQEEADKKRREEEDKKRQEEAEKTRKAEEKRQQEAADAERKRREKKQREEMDDESDS